MHIKRFIQHSGVKSSLSTLILIIPLALGLWENLELLYKILLIAATAILNLVFVYYDYKRPVWKIEDMLGLMAMSLWGRDRSHFRSNVMLFDPKTKKLAIKYRCNMMGAIDRNLCLKPNQGCAGEAFTNNRAAVVDLIQATHDQYRIDPSQVWPTMKSVMSVPICDNEDHVHVIGVLNIDSDLEVNAAKFFDDKVLNTANVYSDLVADWL